ncbi:hypothetical protein Hdeb2414_s0002g00046671 [Helianthus debilis subsp. tardiflorus]
MLRFNSVQVRFNSVQHGSTRFRFDSTRFNTVQVQVNCCRNSQRLIFSGWVKPGQIWVRVNYQHWSTSVNIRVRCGQQVSQRVLILVSVRVTYRDVGSSQRVKPGRLGSNRVDSVNAQSTPGQQQSTGSFGFTPIRFGFSQLVNTGQHRSTEVKDGQLRPGKVLTTRTLVS